MKYYIICSQPRSGNHFIEALFTQNGIGNCQRNFELAMRCEYDISKLLEIGTLNNIWGSVLENYEDRVKNTFDFLKESAGIEDIYEALEFLFPNVYFIYLYRINLMHQSISLSKCLQSGELSFYKKGEESTYLDFIYNEELLEKQMIDYVVRNHEWLDFFKRGNIFPLYLSYEEITSVPLIETVKKIGSFLDLPRYVLNQLCCDWDRMPKRMFDEHSRNWSDSLYAKHGKGLLC